MNGYININQDGNYTKHYYADADRIASKIGSVAMSNVTTTEDFAQDWGDMASSDIKEVNLNYHGSPQTINLNYETNQYLTSTGDGKSLLGNPATIYKILSKLWGKFQ